VTIGAVRGMITSFAIHVSGRLIKVYEK